ncbi:urate hydroxylase PuuD [Marinicella meishanensis]|uniref:urate hydroxylase PuuD n=1 Tax=Marinicella meishanensis TaxID=2873263 RepID=UPI001CBF9AA1|nr:urate hydroxylase PuuD [Marinicella sp. NBU2979]
MEAHITEWLNLSVRWIHIITGIAWIGASFYFIFLENNLNRTVNVREELAGNLWAIHGGGFYYLEKYQVAPQQVPDDLHWFKWEAYFTWLSGMALLVIMYYYNAQVYMIDPSVAALTSSKAVLLGLGTLALGWLVYDGLCRSPLVRHQRWFALLGLVLVLALTYALTQWLSARAAYIHVGAMLGTLMVANVFFVIIPAQKAMVQAAVDGQAVNPQLGKNALRRSIHNNYLTLPVLFIMISHHFPSTFGHHHSWLILGVLMVVGVLVRHWFNLKGQGRSNYWLLPTALLLMVALVIYTKPAAITAPATTSTGSQSTPISDAQAMHIIHTHCSNCHAVNPSSELFTTPPKNLVLESVEQVLNNQLLIKAQVINSRIMPLGNLTQMTDTERAQLGQWLASQAAQSNATPKP